MNFLVLLIALLPWATSPAALLSRILAAASLFSVEMQALTWIGAGTLQTLVAVNVGVAALLAWWQRHKGAPTAAWTGALSQVAPWPAWLLLGGVVLSLNLLLPTEAADPYHLERVAQIERLGTLDYDLAAHSKVNVMGWVYELLLADVRQIPFLGQTLVQLHGVFGLLLFGLALATTSHWWRPAMPSRWAGAVLLVVPVVFHQFVLVKNDLFLAIPAFVALFWLVMRARHASWLETAWAGWLAGFAVAGKLTNYPVALVLMAGVGILAWRGRDWRLAGGLALGGVAGALTGGILFTLTQNVLWYGDLLASGPVAEMGNLTSGLRESLLSIGRLAIGLVDLGQLTGRWWPGRGGWASTFGLPFIWAAVVLGLHYSRVPEARWTVWIAAFHFAAFAAVFPDADLHQRLALAPGLLVISVAVSLLHRDGTYSNVARLALVPVVLLSSAQILRSAVLYLVRVN